MNCSPRIFFWVRRYRNRETARKKSNGKLKPGNQAKDIGNVDIAAQDFTFRELAIATNNFRAERLLGDGGFGRVYKGHLKNNNQFVAVKQLDRNGVQGNKEFLNEVVTLSFLHHENLVNLVGYCVDGDQRLLVYEFMPLGSLLDHLLDVGRDKKALDWNTRMKIATGAARGLEYLHDKANPPVVYRDLKSSNILLDESFNPKLSDFGLAHLGQDGDTLHVSSRVIGTYGYCAPEYARAGQLTLKSDVYSFGVVLLELITGKRAIDTTRLPQEQNLVTWAEPIFKDPKKFPELADPLLEGDFPVKELNQAVAVAALCLQEEDSVRPLIADVVIALSFLSEGEVNSQEDPNFDASPPPSDPAPCEEVLEEGVLLGEGSSAEERESLSKGSNSGGSDGSSSESDGQRSSASSDESEKNETARGLHGKKVDEIHSM